MPSIYRSFSTWFAHELGAVPRHARDELLRLPSLAGKPVKGKVTKTHNASP